MNKPALIAAAGLVLGAAWLVMRQQRAAAEQLQAEAEQGAPVDWLALDTYTAPVSYALSEYTSWSIFEADQADQQATDMTTSINPDRNVRAFLDTIAKAEGTAGPDGYRTLFGGSLFTGWADHPRIAKQFTDKTGRKLWTSAAGRYQFMAVSPLPTGGSTRVDTWDRIKRKLSLPDFSPESQDRAAVELLREAGALAKIQRGDFAGAVAAARSTWASLPGAGYAQPERSLAYLQTAFLNAGGALA